MRLWRLPLASNVEKVDIRSGKILCDTQINVNNT